MIENCVFCEILRKREERIIYENEYFYAILDAFPVTPGHALVIPKRHVPTLLDLNEEEWNVLLDTIKNVIKVIEDLDLKQAYLKMLKNPVNEKSKMFIERILKEFDLSKKPDGYNIGVNIGEAAGQTIFHLHIHIIPRYHGDVPDPTGGVRNIIPRCGNYRT